MTPLINEMWELIELGAKTMQEEDNSIIFYASKQKAFGDLCKDLYHSLSLYMKDPDKPLDRHKMAAIFITSIIKTEVLASNKNETDTTFVGNYVLAVETGLSYMLKALNDKLIERTGNTGKLIEKFYFPEAHACPTDYFRIFYRNLYFANDNKEWGINPLDIAERLFLVEYLTLMVNDMDPGLLKEY